MWTEIALAAWDNLRQTANIIAWVGLICFGLGFGAIAMDRRIWDRVLAPHWPWVRRALAAWATGVAITVLPSTGELWEVRVAMIKLELSSPENVKAGVAEIQRIAKALEDKYLAK